MLVLVNPSFYSKYFTQAYIIFLIKTEAKFSISGEFDHWKDSVRFMLVIGQCSRSARIMYARCCGAFLGVNFVAVFFLNLFSWKFIFDRDLDLLRVLVHPFDMWRTSLSVGLHFLHIDEVFTQSKCSENLTAIFGFFELRMFPWSLSQVWVNIPHTENRLQVLSLQSYKL